MRRVCVGTKRRRAAKLTLGGERWFISMFSRRLIWYGEGSCAPQQLSDRQRKLKPHL